MLKVLLRPLNRSYYVIIPLFRTDFFSRKQKKTMQLLLRFHLVLLFISSIMCAHQMHELSRNILYPSKKDYFQKRLFSKNSEAFLLDNTTSPAGKNWEERKKNFTSVDPIEENMLSRNNLTFFAISPSSNEGHSWINIKREKRSVSNETFSIMPTTKHPIETAQPLRPEGDWEVKGESITHLGEDMIQMIQMTEPFTLEGVWEVKGGSITHLGEDMTHSTEMTEPLLPEGVWEINRGCITPIGVNTSRRIELTEPLLPDEVWAVKGKSITEFGVNTSRRIELTEPLLPDGVWEVKGKSITEFGVNTDPIFEMPEPLLPDGVWEVEGGCITFLGVNTSHGIQTAEPLWPEGVWEINRGSSTPIGVNTTECSCNAQGTLYGNPSCFNNRCQCHSYTTGPTCSDCIDGREGFPSCQKITEVCREIPNCCWFSKKNGISWDATASNTRVRVECPGNIVKKYGFRYCNGTAWENPDMRACMILGMDHNFVTDPLVKTMHQASVLTENVNDSISHEQVKEFASLMVWAKDSFNLELDNYQVEDRKNIAKEICELQLTIASNMLSLNFTEEGEISQILDAVEGSIIQYAEVFDPATETSGHVKFSQKNAQFEMVTTNRMKRVYFPSPQLQSSPHWKKSKDSASMMLYEYMVGIFIRYQGVKKFSDDSGKNTLSTRVISLGHKLTMHRKRRWIDAEDNAIFLTFQNLMAGTHGVQKCVFWKFQTDDVFSVPQWSEEGCSVYASNDTHVTCRCTHMTNFAVLLDVQNVVNNDDPVLQIVSYICLSLSLICLLITFVIFVSLKSLRNNKRMFVHRNLVLALLVAIFFLLLAPAARFNKPFCIFMTVAQHYTLLVAFMWMAVEGFMLFLMLIAWFTQESHHTAFTIAALGVPLFVVGVSLIVSGVAYDFNGHYRAADQNTVGGLLSCWLSPDDSFIWSFASPVAVILIFNISMLVMTLYLVCRRSFRSSPQMIVDKQNMLKQRLLGSWCLTLLLGITWVVGFLMFDGSYIWVAYIFVILNGLQGVLIFVFYCWNNALVRKEYARYLKGRDNVPAWLRKLILRKVDLQSSTFNQHATPQVTSTFQSPFKRIPPSSQEKMLPFSQLPSKSEKSTESTYINENEGKRLSDHFYATVSDSAGSSPVYFDMPTLPCLPEREVGEINSLAGKRNNGAYDEVIGENSKQFSDSGFESNAQCSSYIGENNPYTIVSVKDGNKNSLNQDETREIVYDEPEDTTQIQYEESKDKPMEKNTKAQNYYTDNENVKKNAKGEFLKEKEHLEKQRNSYNSSFLSLDGSTASNSEVPL